jgi:CheY-like chemotaxis protein
MELSKRSDCCDDIPGFQSKDVRRPPSGIAVDAVRRGSKANVDTKHFLDRRVGEKIDLIISDVYMPTLDGVRFHSYVREFTGVLAVFAGFDTVILTFTAIL